MWQLVLSLPNNSFKYWYKILYELIDCVLQLTSEFGTNHVYNVDTFNELTPPSGDLTYLASLGQSIFRTMTNADSEAIW